MNQNLLIILDQGAYAPLEIKSDILATLISENCFTTENNMATFTGALIVKITRKLLGQKKTKEIYKTYFLKNPQITEDDFTLLLSTLVNREPLSLIQDYLYALKLTGWEFKQDDMKKYFDSLVKNMFYPNGQPPTN